MLLLSCDDVVVAPRLLALMDSFSFELVKCVGCWFAFSFVPCVSHGFCVALCLSMHENIV